MLGYYCESSKCLPCPSGSYGADGITCTPCAFGTSSPPISSSCGKRLLNTIVGLQKFYIPFGVRKINVRLWGGGGAGDQGGGESTGYPPHAGGGGGFSMCNVTVKQNSFIYVLVAGGAYGSTDLKYIDPGGTYCTVRVIYQHHAMSFC